MTNFVSQKKYIAGRLGRLVNIQFYSNAGFQCLHEGTGIGAVFEHFFRPPSGDFDDNLIMSHTVDL